ncbi:MAG: 2-hydroxyglutaryl-CoA dehydratase [Clostridia bacterium]|nr:2-hydroxyglutaryl-CoA dehydratase [Clostridia bacterium]
MKAIRDVIKNDVAVLGVDIGSTTIKFALFIGGDLKFSSYKRHLSNVKHYLCEGLKEIKPFLSDGKIKIAFSGSAGLGMANALNLPFVQEVFATSELIKTVQSDTNVVIELGGEDAKVIFFDNGTDERMNGSCAGGTGAFIDQMATLMNLTNEQLDELSLKSEKIYPIASRCGVFAKTDIQPLLNQGAKKEDISASIYQAIVNQTITGLAQGREIKGKVMFLGGPLTFCKGLQKRFVETLKLTDENAIFPSFSRVSVAIGTAIYASKQDNEFLIDELIENANNVKINNLSNTTMPLFFTNDEYQRFKERHFKAKVDFTAIDNYVGNAYLGIDCGSTTTKLVLISEDNKILFNFYNSNNGNPLEVVKEQLLKIYDIIGNRITIKGSVVTGYGEELIKNAFNIDDGLVETLAHYTSAKHFNPKVDYILDIGGQDIKCFKIKRDAIDTISLNEACSSGCGSFLETFAKSLGIEMKEFANLALFATSPVDLGSRCTVFMNSQVKQAQKDGATVGDISAGLSISVVKNALYKVIRETSAENLGNNIVVQGGTFLNDAVLRAFEREIGKEVIRPNIAGLMGAYGCALQAKTLGLQKSNIKGQEELLAFTHTSKMLKCKGCGNGCNLTINLFNDGSRFISGNQCEKGIKLGESSADKLQIPNLYEFKREKFRKLMQCDFDQGKNTIGIPLSLGMYELAPLWKTLFEELGFNVVFSGFTTKKMYQKGQYTIASDTICYPAKVMHGHIIELVEREVDAIFYPSLTFNINEKSGDNCYNCPVVAYYAELLDKNLNLPQKIKFIYPYLNINNLRELKKELKAELSKHFQLDKSKIKKAIEKGINAYYLWKQDIINEGKRALKYAQDKGRYALILAGRPYHIDNEISHGIDKCATSLGFVVLSEDSLEITEKLNNLKVLNQWTFHSRMYNSAIFASKMQNVEIVQLVSFGCGLDAITTDEIKSILESNEKLYTQLKIDEITNLGAVKIRLRSLKGVLDERKKQAIKTK